MSKNQYEKIKKYLDTAGALFDTLTITINISQYIENSDDRSRRYKISGIKCSNNKNNFNFDLIRGFINSINKEILDENNTGFKSNDKKSGWSVFFLIKECIQVLSTENYNFNYYRGQREGKWETIPSAFRNITNDNGSYYYLEFENIYKDIYKKFPEKIEYIEFPKNKSSNEYNDIIRKRGQQLSLLQHYELYTPLLDITSNPYIALLFMTNGELNEPQLEFYDISQSPLFMEPVKNQLNNRILAQKGAFLNYEMLLSKDKNGSTLLEKLTNNNTSSKIPRVILKIKYQTQKDSEKYNALEQLFKTHTYSKISSNNLVEHLIRNKSHQKKNNKTIRNNQKIIYGDNIDKVEIIYSDNIDKLEIIYSDNIDKLEIIYSDNIDKKKIIYSDILSDLRRKLFEFKYIEEDLFPDFEDFLKNKMKLYKPPKEL